VISASFSRGEWVGREQDDFFSSIRYLINISSLPLSHYLTVAAGKKNIQTTTEI